MSVSFTFAQFRDLEGYDKPVLVHGVDCRHDSCTEPEPCEEYLMYALPSGTHGICDHSFAAEAACGCKRFDVNISSANARSILERLGYEYDPEDGICGSATPDEIIGRALLANIGRDDSGIRSAVVSDGPGATMIDCGLRPGYYDERMTAILDLAHEAQRREVLVGWG